MTDSTPEVGVVGLGGMGRNHASWLTDAGAALVGGADVADGARDSFAHEFGVPTYEDHEALYDDADPDAVVITTPNRFHEPAAVAALERGIDVLCEKPLAHTLESAERIADAADASDAFCTVGFHNRYTPGLELFKARQAEGVFGDISHVEAEYVRRRGIPAPGSWFTDRSLAGGGALIDIGVHVIDYAMALLGFPDPVDVSASVRSQFGARDDYADPDDWAGNWNANGDTFDVDDSASAFVTFDDGSTLSLEVSWAANRRPSQSVVVRGTDAGAELSVGGDDLTVLGTGTDPHDHYTETGFDGDADPTGHAAQDAAFVESVAAGEPPARGTLEQGLAVQRLIDTIYEAGE
jgi:predicted dehydrogenase